MPSTVEKWKLCYKVWFEILEQYGVSGAAMKEEGEAGRFKGDPAGQLDWARGFTADLEKLKDLGEYLVAGLAEAEPKTFELGLSAKYKAACRAATEVRRELDGILQEWNAKLPDWQERVESRRLLTISQFSAQVMLRLDQLFPKYEPDLGPLGQKISFKVKKQRKGEDD